jgi:hypothetical protein
MPALPATVPIICIHPVRRSDSNDKSAHNHPLPRSASHRSTSPSRYQRSSLSLCTSISASSDDEVSCEDEDIHIIVIVPRPGRSPSRGQSDQQLYYAQERNMKPVERTWRHTSDVKRELGYRAALGNYKSRQSRSCRVSSLFRNFLAWSSDLRVHSAGRSCSPKTSVPPRGWHSPTNATHAVGTPSTSLPCQASPPSLDQLAQWMVARQLARSESELLSCARTQNAQMMLSRLERRVRAH